MNEKLGVTGALPSLSVTILEPTTKGGREMKCYQCVDERATYLFSNDLLGKQWQELPVCNDCLSDEISEARENAEESFIRYHEIGRP
jgi:hypothetical protein